MSVDKIKAYIYTIPKAGTYLMSEFLIQLGIMSTGWHIGQNRYLDTFSFDQETNKVTPTKTKRKRSYIESFQSIPYGFHAFGHFSPVYVPPAIFGRSFKFLCVKRRPKEVLLSEFIDFRFRRSDVKFVSKNTIKDNKKAFEFYITKHAHVIKSIFQNFIFLEECSRSHAYISLVGKNNFYFLDFKEFINPESGPKLAIELSDFFGIDASVDQTTAKWKNALAADNKTKSLDVSIDIPREEFWTAKALDLYEQINFKKIEERLGY